jgi:phosphonate transport system permease protein
MAGLNSIVEGHKKNPFKRSRWNIGLWILVVTYLVYSIGSLGLNAERFLSGIGHASTLLDRMFPPNFERWELLLSGLVESLEIAMISSVSGIFLSLFIGILAARNLMPPWVSVPIRGFVALCRSFHPVIIAILFVKSVGFGALAGILTLIIASIGFIAKLFAEAIEEISFKQVEAIRATGANFSSFATYQFDSNLRNSTMVGIVGAGGLGGTLFSAFQRFDYDFVAAILITIISLILVWEFLSTLVRRVF